MKKILCLVLITLLIAGVAFAATPGYRLSPGIGENKTTAQGGQQSDPGKTFRIVRYVPITGIADGGLDSATLAAESIVVYDVVSDDGVTVTTTTTSHDSAVAGVIVQAALTPETLGDSAADDRGKRNWTWLQTHGLSEVTVAGTVSAGDALATSTVTGEAVAFVASTSASGANGNAGFFYDAQVEPADDVECFIVCE